MRKYLKYIAQEYVINWGQETHVCKATILEGKNMTLVLDTQLISFDFSFAFPHFHLDYQYEPMRCRVSLERMIKLFC